MRPNRAWLVCACLLFLGLVALQVGCPPAEPTPTPPPTVTTPPEPAEPSEPAVPAEPADAMEIEVPLGLPPVKVPEDNPMTAEKVELGKMLYFDKRVSKDGTISCATCHDPQMAWAEHTPTSTGIKDADGQGQVGGRNSPTVINAAYATSQFWDGREPTLEAQAVGPVGNPIEMGSSMPAVVETFSKIPEYQERFQKVFGTGVTQQGFAKAIAAFERTVLSGNSPYDKFDAGDKEALSEAQQRGWKLFDEHCSICHTPPLFSNFRFYNAGVGSDKEEPDQGAGDGKFRVVPLREVANTHPYFHDGSVATLEEAVAVMADGGIDNPNLAVQLKAIRGELTEADQKDLVEFLKALSGEYPIVEPPELP